MYKYYIDILRKNKNISKLLNKIKQIVNKNDLVDIIGLRGNTQLTSVVMHVVLCGCLVLP